MLRQSEEVFLCTNLVDPLVQPWWWCEVLFTELLLKPQSVGSWERS